MNLDEYKATVLGKGQPSVVSPAKGTSGHKKRVALLVFLQSLEQLGYQFRGTWRKGCESGKGDVWLEYPGIPGRRFRFDISLPAERLAIEIHGGAYVRRVDKNGNVQLGGGHHSPAGRSRDIDTISSWGWAGG